MKWCVLALMVPCVAVAEVPQGPPNADFAPEFEGQTRAAQLPSTDVAVEVFARGLEHPWGIAPFGDGWLVTERPGRMRVVSATGVLSAPIAGLPAVVAERQGGLLDVAVQDGVVYWTYAKAVGGGYVTAAARGELVREGDQWRMDAVRDVFVQDPPSRFSMHYGARIVPDGDVLWITTGEHSDASERGRAQDLGTTYGKIIRVDLEGGPVAGNPFGDTIWSYGHRNVQGAALDMAGDLWTIEHGPRGGDELNRPIAGGNYGWPIVSYGINYSGSLVGDGIAVAPGMEGPVYYWDPVIAPAGMAFYGGDLFEWRGDLLIGSLNPGGLVRLRMDGGRVVGEERMFEGQGRIRDVEVDVDGSVLMLLDDDRGAILRVRPEGENG